MLHCGSFPLIIFFVHEIICSRQFNKTFHNHAYAKYTHFGLKIMSISKDEIVVSMKEMLFFLEHPNSKQ